MVTQELYRLLTAMIHVEIHTKVEALEEANTKNSYQPRLWTGTRENESEPRTHWRRLAEKGTRDQNLHAQ
jgi:hypothetical protein